MAAASKGSPSTVPPSLRSSVLIHKSSSITSQHQPFRGIHRCIMIHLLKNRWSGLPIRKGITIMQRLPGSVGDTSQCQGNLQLSLLIHLRHLNACIKTAPLELSLSGVWALPLVDIWNKYSKKKAVNLSQYISIFGMYQQKPTRTTWLSPSLLENHSLPALSKKKLQVHTHFLRGTHQLVFGSSHAHCTEVPVNSRKGPRPWWLCRGDPWQGETYAIYR